MTRVRWPRQPHIRVYKDNRQCPRESQRLVCSNISVINDTISTILTLKLNNCWGGLLVLEKSTAIGVEVSTCSEPKFTVFTRKPGIHNFLHVFCGFSCQSIAPHWLLAFSFVVVVDFSGKQSYTRLLMLL